jgi:hypothetical protein
MSGETCSRAGCGRAATYAPRLKIPAMGMPIALHQPLAMFVSIELCREHAQTFAQDGLTFDDGSELREAIRRVVAGMGRAEPDFERVTSEPVSINDPDYLSFKSKTGSRH